jgi:hypothetical protein
MVGVDADADRELNGGLAWRGLPCGAVNAPPAHYSQPRSLAMRAASVRLAAFSFRIASLR